MTIKEIHILLEQSLQNMTGFVYEDMEPEEFDNALNTKLYDVVGDIVAKDRQDPKSIEGFEGSILTLEDLATITIPNEKLRLSNKTSELSNVIIYDLPDKHFLPISGVILYRSDFVKPCVNPYTGKEQDNIHGVFRIAEHKNIDNYLDDSNNKTSLSSIIVARSGKNLYIYTSGKFNKDNVAKALLTYIEEPPKIEFGADGSNEYQMPKDFIYHLIHETAIYISLVKDDDKKAKLLSSEDIR